MFSLFKKKDKPDIPSYWKMYNSKFLKKQSFEVLISESEFVVLDLETNGLDIKKDKILSIGAVKIKNNRINISESFEVYLSQSEYNPDAALIHGILREGNLKKFSEQESIIMLLEYLENKTIVGHSIGMDISFINESLKKYVGGKLRNRSIDTIDLYKRWKGADFNLGTSTSLDHLSDEFKIPKSDRHNAAGDSLITAILFMKLVARLKKRGVNSLGDLLKSKRSLI